MNPPQHSDYMFNVSPQHKNRLAGAKQTPLKFVGMSGVQTTRSLNTPNSNALVSGFKARHNEESLKKSTESKIETLRSQIFNPQGQSDASENSSIKSLNPKKTGSETEQLRFEFKPRDRLSRKSQGLKIDSINNALELYIQKKQASQQTASNPSLHMYTKPPSKYHPTQYTSYQQNNSSQEYDIQIQKPAHFKRTSEERADSTSKSRPRCFTHGNKSPCLDDFVLGKRLGKGKFGQVFLVRHKRLGLVCAMKVLSKDTIRENKFQSQLTRQVIIQLYFNHPNVVQMYGMFSENNNFYLLLEPCLDGHLLHELKRKRRFGEEEAADIIRQVLEGVELMHRSDVIHRDLKPENIVRHEGVSKISDFGWAVHSPDNLRQTFCGTPLYMSPQLLIGKQYTQSVDIWAVGMLAYEILIGRLPFKVHKSEELTRIITDQIEFPQHVGLSQTAKDFVMTILKKNPVQRCDLETLFYHPFLNKLRES